MAGHAWLQAAKLVGRVAAIGPDAAQDEVNWEEGMRALVLAVEQDCDEVWITQLDFRPFMDTNRPLMTPNYYDANGVPRLTAEESTHWSDIDTWYMPPPGVAWSTRVLMGPVWKPQAPGFQQGRRGLGKLSVFATPQEEQAWRRCTPHALAQVRGLADAAGFRGGLAANAAA
jgi:hypothetical protein